MLSARTLDLLTDLAVFINTAPGMRGGQPQDERLAYGTQIPDVVPAVHEGRTKVRVADAALVRAHELREQLTALWTSVAAGEDATEAINRLLERVGPVELHTYGPTGELEVGPAGSPPDAVERLTAIAGLCLADAAVTGELVRLRLCEGDGCDNVLVDASRNRSKRFCDEANCGNRMHVRSYRARQAELEDAAGEEQGAGEEQETVEPAPEAAEASDGSAEPAAPEPAEAGTDESRVDVSDRQAVAALKNRVAALKHQRKELKKRRKAAKKSGDKRAKKQTKKDLEALEELLESRKAQLKAAESRL